MDYSEKPAILSIESIVPEENNAERNIRDYRREMHEKRAFTALVSRFYAAACRLTTATRAACGPCLPCSSRKDTSIPTFSLLKSPFRTLLPWK